MPIHLQIGETMDYEFLPYDEFRELVCSDRFVASEQGRFIAHEELMKKHGEYFQFYQMQNTI